MDKYEYRVKTEQLLEYSEKKQYRKAMEIADTIDWRRVKSVSMLNTVSEAYEYCGEFQKSRDILLMAFDRSPGSRKIVYRLATLALKVNDPEEASDCYEEFVKLAPKDPNQYILKYRILKAQKAPLEEQIAALEEFKKAEYIEKWAYELAKLYHEAGMVRECLEECDDLILWFSEGKYVYLAMELKMKYKPLTPLQQEKYDKHTGKKTKDIVIPGQDANDEEDSKEDVSEAEPAKENVQKSETLKEKDEPEEEDDGQTAIPAEEAEKDLPEEAEPEDAKPEETKKKPRAPITRIVTGATLEEALASGVAMAAGLNKEEKAMADRDEELKVNGQMKIEDILQEWEEKQKVNANAIEKQKAEDKERLKKERREAEKRKEASRKAAEEAARKAEEEARKKAEEEAKRKTEEEAKKRAAEEEARRKAEEEARKAEEEAKKAEEARKKAAEEAKKEAKASAAQKAVKTPAGNGAKTKKIKKNILEEKTQKLPDDILELVEQLENRVAGTSAPQKEDMTESDDFESEGLLEGVTEDLAKIEPIEPFAEELLDGELDEEEPAEEENVSEEDGFAAEDFEEDLPAEAEEDFEEDDFIEEEPEEDEFEEDDFIEEEPEEDEFEEDEFIEEESDEEEFEEDGFEEDEFIEEEPDEEDFEEDGFEEDEFIEESDEEEFEEDEFIEEESDEEEFEEDEFMEEESDEEDFEEDGFEEEDFDEEDFDEDDFIEDEEDFDEDEFDEDDFDEDDFESDEEDFEEDEFDEEELSEDGFEEEELEEELEEEISLEIEEPSEEEIQKRFKKAKGGGGVPFDTGFVVTGRYDLSATSEIGLKAGLTEEQKKLFSYFVPVRGMSEQIVEALDNDRRAQREGTSKTGNILVIGRKGSGKTVLAVDIVKAIQKQRNLKQGKVAIVTGESLNKKELPNIIQKLKGGAIIVEKAGKLNSRTVKELNHLMERKTGEMLFVLEDQRKPLEKILTANPDFKKKFTSKLELPIFINDELVTFGQTYAKENGYKLDEMGILALYSRIDVMQREDHAVSVAEVKDIMDEAISHSQRVNVKHLARRVFGKGTDDSDRIILKEEDFKI